MSSPAANSNDDAENQPDNVNGNASGVEVVVTSVDGGEFTLPLEAARLSELIRDSLNDDEEGGEDDGDGNPAAPAGQTTLGPFPLLRVGRIALEKVVDFLLHYHEEKMSPIPTPLGAGTFHEIVQQEWYRRYCDEMPQEMLFEVLRAANYMAIPPLLDLACLKVTFQLHGCNAEQIREMLNLPTLTPEEEERARQEHRWIFENNN